jgi:hypothetical protein
MYPLTFTFRRRQLEQAALVIWPLRELSSAIAAKCWSRCLPNVDLNWEIDQASVILLVVLVVGRWSGGGRAVKSSWRKSA